MGAKLSNAPVYFTIGQINHNPLLSLESYLPQIQESMRKAGFPAFKKSVRVALNLTAAESDDSGQLPSERVEIFQFANIADTSGFAMTADSFSFQTTDYQDFQTFWAELSKGLEILDSAVGGLSFVERLGLRYLDAIMPEQGESTSAYVVPELLGLPPLMPQSLFAYSFAESLLVHEGVGQVKSRTIVQIGNIVFPPDLQTTKLKLLDRFGNFRGEHAILDMDGSISERHQFDIADMKRRIDKLHDLVSECFEAAVTENARSVWGRPKEVV